ncbi:MAG: hypothetical protein Q8P00_05725 [Dehalococcoidia bacterium]|nr:hypothetical protein [Dehalococcoidia bacterium]
MEGALSDVRLRVIFNGQLARGCVITSWDEWEPFVRRAHAALIEEAKKKCLITYGDLARLIGMPTFPDYEWFPLKIAWVAGACSQYELDEGYPLISSLAVNQDTSRPGAGYWGFSTMPQHLLAKHWEDRHRNPPEPVQAAREDFWVKEVKRVHDHWASQ